MFKLQLDTDDPVEIKRALLVIAAEVEDFVASRGPVCRTTDDQKPVLGTWSYGKGE